MLCLFSNSSPFSNEFGRNGWYEYSKDCEGEIRYKISRQVHPWQRHVLWFKTLCQRLEDNLQGIHENDLGRADQKAAVRTFCHFLTSFPSKKALLMQIRALTYLMGKLLGAVLRQKARKRVQRRQVWGCCLSDFFPMIPEGLMGNEGIRLCEI